PKGEAAEASGSEGPLGGKKQPEPVSPGVAADEDFFSLPQDSGTPEASPGQAVTPSGPKMAKAKPVRIRKSGKAVKTPPPKKTAKKPPRSKKSKPKTRAAMSKTPKKPAKPRKSPSTKRRKK
ncbi:unnamed protein product, partial [Cylicostephanus goldi]